MKRFITGAIILGLVTILAIATVVSAQDQTPPTPQPGNGWGWGRGHMGEYGGSMHTYMQQAMADALGLTVEELQERHDAGQTFWQIAEEKGLTQEEATQLMLDARDTALELMVEDGALTAEQAEWMKSHSSGMMGGRKGGMMGGMMGRGGHGACMGGADGTQQQPQQQRFGPGMMRGRWSQQDG